MNDTLKKLMGCRDSPEDEPLKGEKCAWRYHAEEHLQQDIPVPERHAKCEYCNGYPPEGCPSYATLSHLEHFYDIFQAKEKESSCF